MTPRIAALLMSFNRPDMAQRCIHALRAQTFPLAGIVVGDGSTQPEPRGWLAQQPDVTLRAVDNLGSAGSLCAAMEWALQHDYEWFWTMDDDVLPRPDALAALVRAMELHPERRVLNSLAVGQEDPARPSVGAYMWRSDPADYLDGTQLFTVAEIRAHADPECFVDSAGGQVYQGTLFHRTVVEKVGLPKTELFTRGDEVEYALRVMRAGYHIYTYLPSVVSHPSTEIVFIHILGRTLPCESMNAKQRYYNLRNSFYIRREYYPVTPLRRYAARRLVGAFFTELVVDRRKNLRQRWQGCAAAWRGVRDGLAWAAR